MIQDQYCNLNYSSLGFAELQTDLDELTGDLAGSRLPYHDFHVYILQSLFPGSKDHPVLHELQVRIHLCNYMLDWWKMIGIIIS